MSFLNKISGKKNKWKESDNKGEFHNTPGKADKYWENRNKNKIIEPFLLYKFNDISDAVRALMELECIKVAEDTEELICTKELIYGYYEAGKENYEAVVSGRSLDRALFLEAKKAFIKNNGRKVNELAPEELSKMLKEKEVIKPEKKKKSQSKSQSKKDISGSDKKSPKLNSESKNKLISKVEFYKDEEREQDGKKLKYKIYKAPTAVSAVSFLQKRLITRKDLCLFVRTPQGNYYRNYTGLYKKKQKKK